MDTIITWGIVPNSYAVPIAILTRKDDGVYYKIITVPFQHHIATKLMVKVHTLLDNLPLEPKPNMIYMDVPTYFQERFYRGGKDMRKLTKLAIATGSILSFYLLHKYPLTIVPSYGVPRRRVARDLLTHLGFTIDKIPADRKLYWQKINALSFAVDGMIKDFSVYDFSRRSAKIIKE